MRFSRLILSAFGLMALTAPLMAQERPTALIAQYDKWDHKCRGESGDKPSTLDACEKREQIGARIKPYGWCVGRTDQPTSAYTVHRCGPGSINYDGTEYKSTATKTPSKSYAELLKGTWRTSDYKSCKAAKDVDGILFFNGLKLTGNESDCIVMDTKNGNKTVSLKLMCVSEGERLQSRSVFTFKDDNTVQSGPDEYKRCS